MNRSFALALVVSALALGLAAGCAVQTASGDPSSTEGSSSAGRGEAASTGEAAPAEENAAASENEASGNENGNGNGNGNATGATKVEAHQPVCKIPGGCTVHVTAATNTEPIPQNH